MLPTFGLGFKIPIKLLMIQMLLLLLLFSLAPEHCVFGQDDEEEEYSGYCNLHVNYFTEDGSWTNHVGATPYIDASDAPTNYVYNSLQTDTWDKIHWFGFEWNASISEISNVTLSVRGARVYTWGQGLFVPRINSYGVDWNLTQHSWDSSTFSYHNWTGIESYLDTAYKLQTSLLMLQHNISSNGGLAIDHAYYIVGYTYIPPSPPFSVVDQYTWLGIGLGGIALMVWSPAWVAWKIKKKGIDVDTIERIGFALVIFVMGFGLFISWLYH